MSQAPSSITGGCLCGAIRYTMKYPADAERSDLLNATCQCTMCRKFTGALAPQSITGLTSNISPPLASHSAYKTYRSSSFAYRSFCGTCGSSLAFNYDDQPETTEIYLGSLDEEVLCGKKVADAEGGALSKREGSDLGHELCKSRAHIWVDNMVKGVTDNLEGTWYVKGREMPYTGKRT